MAFLSWLTNLLAARSSSRGGRRPIDSARRSRPGLRVEVLEGRLVPSFTPLQIRHAYGFDRITFQDATHAQIAGDGAGQTIALIDAFDHPNIIGDLATFDSFYGLPAPPSFVKVSQNGDTHYPPPAPRDWAMEIALDVEYAHAMAPAANILLVEANDNDVTAPNLEIAVQYAASHGATVISMSYGAREYFGETYYDNYYTHPGVTYLAASGDNGAPGLHPAYSPNVVAVGGTSLYLDGSGNYGSESGWSGSGGGISQYEAQPAYQRGVVTQSSTRRCIPDLSFEADPYTGVIIYTTYGGSGYTTVGGTSLACPLMAGLTAIVNQGRSYLLGQPSYNGLDFLNAIYHLPASNFHDITTGYNGFYAGPGYDLVTGIGTPIADRFAVAMAESPATTTTLNASAATSVYGQSVTFTATVTATGSPVTSGSVTFLDGTTTLGTVNVDANGHAAYTTSLLNASSSPHAIRANYSPSGLYLTSFDTARLTVSRAALTVTVDNKMKVYGQVNPALTATLTGLVNGDTQAVISGLTLSTTATTSSGVGSYPITAAGGTASNYTITYMAGTLTVNPAPLTISADNKTKVYGQANPALTTTITGLVNGDTQAVISGLTVATTATATSGVGTYPITASGASAANYAISYAAGTFSITRAPLSVTADSKTRAYGSANPALTFMLYGLVNGDTAAIALTGSLATTATTSSSPGSYPISQGTLAAANYTITFSQSYLTITQAPLTISADNKTKVYGQANPALTATFTGLVNGDTPAVVTGLTLTTYATASSGVGSYPIYAYGGYSANYSITFVNGTLTVTRAPLTVTADNKTRPYGQANPVLTAVYTGFVNGETAATALTGSLATTATTGSSPGTYPITQGTLAAANYSITFSPAILTVTPAPLTISADNKTKVYGQANPALTTTITGLVNGDTQAVISGLTVTTTATASSGAGTYPITASGASAANYAISYAAGTFSITRAPLSVTADSKTRAYGSPNPALTSTLYGLVNGDTAATALTGGLATTATTSSSPGSYPISQGTLAAANYSITFSQAYLTVTQAPLTISADNKTRMYGQPNPPLTATFTGLVNGDTPAVVTGLTLTTYATSTSLVGTYPIYASGGYSPNYTITFVNGTLTVTGSPTSTRLTTSLSPSTYGQSVTFTATVTGTGPVAGVTVTFTDGATTLGSGTTNASGMATLATGGLGAGTQTVTATFAGGGTQSGSSGSVSQVVNRANLTLSADNKSKVYGSANPALTASYAGFVNGDTSAVVSGLTLTTAATGSGVGSYPITPSGASAANYAISYVAGTLTITRAPLTVAADYKSRPYGSPNPSLTVTAYGLVNGDTTATALTGSPATTATTSSPPGYYPISQGTLAAANYSITFSQGYLTVTQAPLTITADNKTRAYGSPNPTLTATFTGLVNGDTPAVVSGLILTTYAVASSGVGSYPIYAYGGYSANYNITFVNGTLTVTRAPLTISADNKTRPYGQPNPTLTASYAGFVNGDTSAVVSGLTLTTTATTSSPVGSYPITPSGASAVNYAISYVNGTLTVTGNPTSTRLTTSLSPSAYGQSVAFTATVTGSGPIAGATVTFTDGATTLGTGTTNASGMATLATAMLNTGSHTITATYAGGGSLTGSSGSVSQVVNRANLTISADNKTKVYGSVNPALTASYAGFVNGDTSAVVSGLMLSTTATAGSGVGSYPITPSGASAANYTISYGNGTLTVTPAPLTISADNKSKVYGQANPALTASYSGFVNGDTAAVVSELRLSTTATVSSGVGSYAITASGASAANYTISYGNGTLSVTPAPLTITADIQSKVAGNPVPTLTASYSGFVNGDTSANLTTPVSLSTYTGDTAGSYPIVPSGATAANYTIAFVNGTLIVTPASTVSLVLSTPATLTAGQAFNSTVTAMDAYGNVATGYTGTVSLTSSDPQAANLGSYTFTSSDAGMYTFSGLQLFTAGPQSLTASNGTLSAQANVTVNPDVAASLVLSAPSSTTAGAAFSVTVTAYDAWGNVATGYTGTVSLTSSDPQASSLGSYSFTSGDAGMYNFSGLQLFTAGPQSLTASDGTLSAQANLTVNPDVAASLVLSGPSSTTAGTPFQGTVTAYDAWGNVATGYLGTITFSCTDAAATLPADYPFQPGDQGMQSFQVTLNTPGTQQLTVTDAANPALTASLNVTL